MREYSKLEEIQEKIVAETATPTETEEFLDLIVKSGNEIEMLNYMKTIGFNSIEEVRAELKKQQKSEGIIAGLAIAGGAILLAALLSK